MSGGSGSTGRVSGTAAPRYAPEDPSLPKPWRGLVDGTTGYLYYWNPETNTTQYEKPLPPEDQLPPPPPPLPPPPPRARGRDRDRRDRSRSRTPPRRDHRDRDHRRHDEHNSSKSASSHHHPPPAAAPAAAPTVSADDPSTEAYRRRHEINVIGDNVPAPITAFESGGFPPEILKEMRYLLRGGANVVRCLTRPRPIYKCGGLRADVVDGAAKGGWTPKVARSLPGGCPWRKGAPTSADSLLCVQFFGKAPRMDGGPLLGPDYGGLAQAVNVQI